MTIWLVIIMAADSLRPQPPTLAARPQRDTVWISTGNPLEPKVPFDANAWTRAPAPLPPRKKNDP